MKKLSLSSLSVLLFLACIHARLAAESEYKNLAIGLGYPDLRLRSAIGFGCDAEAKFAFSEGVQVYSARVLWNFADWGPLKFTGGVEGGWAKFDSVEDLSGTGLLGGGFLGAEFPFAKRLRLSIDAGPAWVQASSEGQSTSSVELIYNTALYFYFF